MWRRWPVMWLLAPAGVAAVVAIFVISSLYERFLLVALDALVSLLALLLRMGAKRRDAWAAERDCLRDHVCGADTHGRLPKVRDANQISQLGVHEAISLPDEPGTSSLDPHLPAYACRDEDWKIDEALRRGGLVVAQGASASGLTRIISEAIKRCYPSWSLVIPANRSTSLPEIAKIRTRMRDMVIFLGSLEEHVLEGGLNAHVLDALCPNGRVNVVIVATFTPATDGSAQLAEVLRRATVVHVPLDLSNAERQRARSQVGHDSRVAEALAQRGEPFAQYLSSGPAAQSRVLRARDGAQPAGAAIVLAALECRRLGMGFTLTRERLHELHRFYLASRPSRKDFDAGMQWATHKVIGTVACLNPVGDDEYEPLPYLVKHASTLLSGTSQTGRAFQALNRFLAAARGGNADAAYHAGLIYRDMGERDQAKAWFRTAAYDSAYNGHLDAMYQLAVLNYEDGGLDPRENARIESALWHAAKRGHRDALNTLNKVLRENNDVDGLCEIDKIFASETQLRSTTAEGSTPRRNEYETALRNDAAEGDVSAMNSLGVFLTRTGRTREALEWLTRAAQAGNEVAADNLMAKPVIGDDNNDAYPDTNEEVC
jgi:tetratricopeptide (TPR) repeat protein